MRNRKGYSALIGTIIMVLVVVFLYFNVYLYTLDRNKDFQDVVSRSQQLDADRTSEKVTISSANYTNGGGGAIVINCTLINSGSVPTQIVRLWLQDTSIPAPNVGNSSLLSGNFVLQPGVTKFQNFSVLLPGASSSDSFALRLVTSRANLIMYP
jgi:flagellin-like protein